MDMMSYKFLWKFATLVLFLFFQSSCATTVPGLSTSVTGVLRGNVSWQGTVFIGGDVMLEKGAKLTIAPGTEIVFLPPAPGQDIYTVSPNFPGSELIIRGTLIAEGTAAAPIFFRYVDPKASAGSWGGINLLESPETRLRQVRIIQANSAIHSHRSKVVIEESVVANNLFGLRFSSTNFLIQDNLLRENGTAIRFHFGAPVIRNNVITDNEKGIFITSYPDNYRIEGNNIVANRIYSVVLGEEVPADVRLTGNYWGTDKPEAIVTSFYDGRTDVFLGKVLFEPFEETSFSSIGVTWKP